MEEEKVTEVKETKEEKVQGTEKKMNSCALASYLLYSRVIHFWIILWNCCCNYRNYGYCTMQ